MDHAVLGICLLLSVAGAACGGDDTAAVTAAHDSGVEAATEGEAPEASLGDHPMSGSDDASSEGSKGEDAPSGDGALPLAAPITAPAGKWTWVDFPDSVCDDGTPTGIGIRPSATSDKLVVFFNGGGACWDYTTCAVLGTSVHGPFGAAQFAALSGGNFAGTLFDDALLANPFKGANAVFIPYCTGDLHAGDAVTTYMGAGGSKAISHKGHTNALAFLARIAATFKTPGQVVVTGSSAGGGGALFNLPDFRAYWPTTPMELIDDSLPLFVGNAIPAAMRSAWFANWNLGKVTDPLCGAACRNDLSLFMSALAKRYAGDRMALLSSQQDQTIRSYFLLTADAFSAALGALTTDVLDPVTNFRLFSDVTGPSHTMLAGPAPFTSHGVPLLTWLSQMTTGDASWVSVGPSIRPRILSRAVAFATSRVHDGLRTSWSSDDLPRLEFPRLGCRALPHRGLQQLRGSPRLRQRRNQYRPERRRQRGHDERQQRRSLGHGQRRKRGGKCLDHGRDEWKRWRWRWIGCIRRGASTCRGLRLHLPRRSGDHHSLARHDDREAVRQRHRAVRHANGGVPGLLSRQALRLFGHRRERGQ